jgi:hypothetical protein
VYVPKSSYLGLTPASAARCSKMGAKSHAATCLSRRHTHEHALQENDLRWLLLAGSSCLAVTVSVVLVELVAPQIEVGRWVVE